ncbi:MAG: hypothetical protein QM727_06120 [Niabella sp.]
MEQQDYLKRQIDQIGWLLGRMLTDLVRLKGEGKMGEGVETVNQAFSGELDLDIAELLNIPAESFVDTLIGEKNIGVENLDKLADVLLFIADNAHDVDRRALYGKCLIIYEYLEEAENVYSFDRRQKIEQIKNMLV